MKTKYFILIAFLTAASLEAQSLSDFGSGRLTVNGTPALGGCTHIVNTNNGVLFYNSATGLEVMVDVTTGGVINTRSATVGTIAKGYTAIAADTANVMFYNAATGDVAIGAIRKFSASAPELNLPGLIAGSLEIRSLFPAQFSPGWTHLVTVTPPAPPLQ